MALPNPPSSPRPRVVTWPAKRSFSRIHPVTFRPTEFAFQAGVAVPVLYGAKTNDAAIAEVIFGVLSVSGDERFLRLEQLSGLALSVVSPKRDLLLIKSRGHGLRRLYESARRADGLLWMSRQFNSAQALTLFGDRVEQDDLEHDEPLELSFGKGLALVEAAALAAGITITS